MATHTCKVLLSLGRMKSPAFTPHSPLGRVTYATALSTNRPNSNKGFTDGGNRGGPRKKRISWVRESGEPRTEKMAVDQDWTAVYPAWAPFRHGSVPLPVRMGKPMRGGVPPEKKGNLELIKIPNFLHLTPAAIKKHCDALKPFCTEWPSALESDAVCDELFPIKLKSSDYVHAGTSLRNPSARIVHLKVKLSSLNLDDHARKKMIKLLGDRYCKQTDTINITTDSCPLKQQNNDYAMYLLTVLYHESWKTEAWEAEKTVADMEEYCWEDSPSQKNILKNILNTFVGMKVVEEGDAEAVREEVLGWPEVQEYRDSVTRLKNEGESESTMLQYRESVRKLFNL